MASGKSYRISIKGVAPGGPTTNSIWEAQTGLSELIKKKRLQSWVGKGNRSGKSKGKEG